MGWGINLKYKATKKRKRTDRRRQTSIYFLLWAVFSALSLVIVLLLGVTQRVIMVQTYKREAVRELTKKGTEIQTLIRRTPPADVGGDRTEMLRAISAYYNVNVYLLSDKGDMIAPQTPDLKLDAEEIETLFDFSEEIVLLKEQLAQTEEEFVVYEYGEEYVYGTKISLYNDSEVYLYVSKSIELFQAATSQMNVRLWLIALFMFILSFAVSSAVSGWLTRPLTEMTKKARQLAHGDFNVDFHGTDYGQEMVELADMLNYARDELSKTDKMQKELIANVSHDFKTPLTMIKAYASMIMEISGNIPEKRNKHAQVIVDEADRLTSLVSDVLDLSKIQSGIESLKLTAVDMSAYLLEIVGRFHYLTETQGYCLETDIDDDLYARVDEVKMGQALYNLIGNAVNYTGEDKKVFVSMKRQEGNIRFAVRDTGAGIKQKELADIWDRYYRSSKSHKRPVNGTGLGLSIVKTIFEKHGFAFGVQSEEGKGSTFYVVFPEEKGVETENKVDTLDKQEKR